MSIWEQQSFFARHDIIIIGAGLAGLWTALELRQKYPSRSILILEKGVIPTGASTRNAGFACFGSPTELLHDRLLLGEEKMLEIAAMRYRGIQKIKALFSDNQIGYEDCGGYECLNKNLTDISMLEDVLPTLNHLLKAITGLDETFTWQHNKLSDFGLSGFDTMIENPLEASLHSGWLVQNLTRLVQEKRIDLLTGIDVKNWKRNNRAIIINAVHYTTGFHEQALAFESDQLVLCTNAFTSQVAPELNIIPARGQVIVTSPIEELKLKGTYHYDEGFYYFRNLGNRILLGGARNKAIMEEATTHLHETSVIQDELERFLQEHIAGEYHYTIDYRWSGIMGFTEDKQPLLKQLDENIFALIACNGMGVALTPVISEQLAAMV